MFTSLTAHPAHALAKLGRYLAVSLIGTATTLILLGVLVGWLDVRPVWANLGAAGSSTALSFELDRRWVWRRQGRPLLVGQVLPFWAWSLADLAVATVAVGWVGARAERAGYHHDTLTTLVELTSIVVSMMTWCVQYFLFDRVVFKDRRVHLGADVPRPVAPGVPPQLDRAPSGAPGARKPTSGAVAPRHRSGWRTRRSGGYVP